jgi:hypothetical protein
MVGLDLCKKSAEKPPQLAQAIFQKQLAALQKPF